MQNVDVKGVGETHAVTLNKRSQNQDASFSRGKTEFSDWKAAKLRRQNALSRPSGLIGSTIILDV